MKYLGAYMLAKMSGKDDPSADDVKRILSSVGAEVDEDTLTIVLGQLTGKNLQEVIAAGESKFASVPAGGGGGSGGGGGGGGSAEAAVVEKEEEKEEEEEDEDMGFSLFD